MADHEELVAELAAIEKMNTGERLKHARKKRTQQLKRYAQYEKDLSKKTTTGSKNKQQNAASRLSDGQPRRGVRFVSNVILLEAAMRNDIDEVRQLLKNGTSPDSCNEDGLTALHQCCIDNSEEMVRLLVEHDANIDARDSELWTPLHAAATCGHVHLCRYLIEHNADLLAVNADCNMPYDICEDEVTLDYIESEMAKRGITQILIDDLRLSREKTMLSDLEKVVTANGDVEFRGRQGETPLHIAAANGYVKVTEFLLGHDATVDCIDNDTWQPIHCAACWGQLEVLELLLEHGASLDAKTKNGETPVDICEDVELKQRIEEIRQAVENSRIVKAREIPHRRSINVRSSGHSAYSASGPNSMYSSNLSMHEKTQVSASVRRTSMREKKAISWKEAREEAQKLRESATVSNGNDDDDDEGKGNGIDTQTKKHNLLTVESVDSNEVTVTLTTDGAKFERPSQPNVVSKVEIVPKSILSKSKKNGHTPSGPSKPEQSKGVDPSLSERRATTFSPKVTENPLSSNDGSATNVSGPDASGTTLAELKRQRAQARTGSTPTTPSVSAIANGGAATPLGSEQKQRFSSTTDVVGSEENSKSCCVIL